MVNRKSPEGVVVRGEKIRIHFMYEGKRYFKSIPNIVKVNKQSLMYASNKRTVILLEIKEGTFRWANHFPDSEEAKLETGLRPDNPTISELVSDWLDVNSMRLADSTISNYRKHSRRIVSYFGEMKAKDLRKSDVLKFQSHIVGEKNFDDDNPLPVDKQKLGLSVKTCNETFIVLRGAITDAYFDDLLPQNVFERVRNLEHDSDSEPDPLLESELTVIEELMGKYHRPQDILMILANCWMGLSVSELCALAWEDIDFLNRKVVIRRALVDGKFKVPKEVSREREFYLLDPAVRYLKMMKQYSMLQEPIMLTVKKRDNVKSRTDSVRLVFKNITAQNDQGRWDLTTLQRQFNHIFDKAGVRRRGSNQTRHTFASRMITKLVPLEMVAQLMGHTSIAMLRKHYGKIIKSEQPNTARIISQIIGIEYTEDQNNQNKERKDV